jgi:tubulin---tyrosine ligase
VSKLADVVRCTGWNEADSMTNRGSTSASEPSSARTVHARIDYPDAYVQPLVLQALDSCGGLDVQFIDSMNQLPGASYKVLQVAGYEDLDFEHAVEHSTTSLLCAYVIRKALIRKHYLSNTVSTWLVKHPDSTLAQHFKPCTHFELDFAEFLDEALVDAWDLNESMTANNQISDPSQKSWWILKPGMSDGGNGIRLFSSLEELQAIFEEWDEPSDEEDEEDENAEASDRNGSSTTFITKNDGKMTSQLRHFIAQPYILRPLLLSSYTKRKFHVRTYVLAVGALRVYVYRPMLALFAANPYTPPMTEGASDLRAHLTNTCFQDESTKTTSVHPFWDLNTSDTSTNWKTGVFEQICQVTGEVFEAAAKEQMVHFQTLPNAFEVFGVDFLVDDTFNVWLLELNAYPDFRQTGEGLQEKIVGGLFEETAKVAIEPFFNGGSVMATDRMTLVKDIDLGRR